MTDERVFSEVEEAVDAEPAEEHTLKGFDLPVRAYSIAGLRVPTGVRR